MATVDPLDILTWASDIEAPTIAASEAILFGTRGLTLLCALVSLPLKQQQYLLSASPSLLCPQYPKTGLAASFAAAFFFLTYISAGSSSFFFFLALFSFRPLSPSHSSSPICWLWWLQSWPLSRPFSAWPPPEVSSSLSLSLSLLVSLKVRGRKVEDDQLIQRNQRKKLKKREESRGWTAYPEEPEEEVEEEKKQLLKIKALTEKEAEEETIVDNQDNSKRTVLWLPPLRFNRFVAELNCLYSSLLSHWLVIFSVDE